MPQRQASPEPFSSFINKTIYISTNPKCNALMQTTYINIIKFWWKNSFSITLYLELHVQDEWCQPGRIKCMFSVRPMINGYKNAPASPPLTCFSIKFRFWYHRNKWRQLYFLPVVLFALFKGFLTLSSYVFVFLPNRRTKQNPIEAWNRNC
jgi:hypothetical protein